MFLHSIYYFVLFVKKKKQMPKNKLASFRYRVINNCLKNTARSWTRTDLTDEIDNQLFDSFGIDKGISKRTFHYDIDIMRSLPPRGFDAPIVVKNGCYQYEDLQYSIDSIPLSNMDIESINNAVDLLSQFKQIPIHLELSLVREKVTGQILSNSETSRIIEFEYRVVSGTEYLTPLYQMIKEKRVVNIAYHSFRSSEPKEFIIHPYFLKQYNHRWYLIGLTDRFDNIGIYSLDRIKSVEIEPTVEYKIDTFINHTVYFEDVIGVTVLPNEAPVEIVIWVSSDQAPYIITKPIHHSQTVIEEMEGGMKIRLKIIPNYEFYSTILSFGGAIKILSPEFIQDEIYKKLMNACRNYEPTFILKR